jgi:hypothetical protein
MLQPRKIITGGDEGGRVKATRKMTAAETEAERKIDAEIRM